MENGNNSKRNSETGVPNLDVQQQPQQYILELHVYTRRGNQQRVEDLVHPATCHNSHSNSGNSQVPLLAINSDDLPIALRKGICSSTQHPIAQVVKYNHLSSSMKALVSNLAEVEIPKTIEEALLKKEWKNATEEEMKALEKNRTWEVVSKPRDVIPVECKWVFTVKYKSDESI